ncbi:MAG: helix-turn-helix domain-containing protein [Terriglobia bacterium]
MKAPLARTRAGKRECSKIDAHVGSQIRRRRVLAGITQQDMGKVLGISFQQVQKYENGSNRISAGRLFLVANLLGATVNDFYAGLESAAPDVTADCALRRVEQFAASREGMSLNLAYLDAPNARSRKLALEILRLGAKPGDK